MQSDNPSFAIPAVFTIQLFDHGKSHVTASKVVNVPYLPKVGDQFTLHGPELMAEMLVDSICFNLSTEHYEISLDSLSNSPSLRDFTDLADMVAELQSQGWTVE